MIKTPYFHSSNKNQAKIIKMIKNYRFDNFFCKKTWKCDKMIIERLQQLRVIIGTIIANNIQ